MPGKIDAHCAQTGQARPANHGEYARAILESLALRYRQVLENLETLSGRTIEVIHIVGGGSRNTLLNQFVADCTGRRVVAGPSEATAIGNILVQAMGAGSGALAIGGGALAGLTCNTPYHFRAVATNLGGTTNGLDGTFTTAACPAPARPRQAAALTGRRPGRTERARRRPLARRQDRRGGRALEPRCPGRGATDR